MANEFIMRKGYKSLANSEITGSLTTTGDIDTSGNLYLDNNKSVFAKNTSSSNYGLLTITSGNVIKLGAYSYTSAATQIGLGNNGTFLIGTETAFSIANNKNATFAGDVTIGGGDLNVGNSSTVNSVINMLGTNDSFIEKDTGNHLYFVNNVGDKDIKFRVKDDTTNIIALTLDGSEGGNATFAGNITLTGGGTIEAPSSSGNEDLNLKAAGSIDVVIDSNGNSGDDQTFRVLKHSNSVLFTVAETGQTTVSGELEAASLDINGNADISGHVNRAQHFNR